MARRLRCASSASEAAEQPGAPVAGGGDADLPQPPPAAAAPLVNGASVQEAAQSALGTLRAILDFQHPEQQPPPQRSLFKRWDDVPKPPPPATGPAPAGRPAAYESAGSSGQPSAAGSMARPVVWSKAYGHRRQQAEMRRSQTPDVQYADSGTQFALPGAQSVAASAAAAPLPFPPRPPPFDAPLATGALRAEPAVRLAPVRRSPPSPLPPQQLSGRGSPGSLTGGPALPSRSGSPGSLAPWDAPSSGDGSLQPRAPSPSASGRTDDAGSVPPGVAAAGSEPGSSGAAGAATSQGAAPAAPVPAGETQPLNKARPLQRDGVGATGATAPEQASQPPKQTATAPASGFGIQRLQPASPGGSTQVSARSSGSRSGSGSATGQPAAASRPQWQRFGPRRNNMLTPPPDRCRDINPLILGGKESNDFGVYHTDPKHEPYLDRLAAAMKELDELTASGPFRLFVFDFEATGTYWFKDEAIDMAMVDVVRMCYAAPYAATAVHFWPDTALCGRSFMCCTPF